MKTQHPIDGHSVLCSCRGGPLTCGGPDRDAPCPDCRGIYVEGMFMHRIDCVRLKESK